MSKTSNRGGPGATLFQAVVVAALFGFGLYFDEAASESVALSPASPPAGETVMREATSTEVRRLVHWIVETHDHADLPFLVVDKVHARIYAFDAQGAIRAAAPVLLGAAHSDIAEAAATPAGRFVADVHAAPLRDGIVWVNGGASLAMHALPSEQAPGRAPQRLASDRVEDKRISEGSLHVGADFYKVHVSGPRSRPGVVYVLPETVPVERVFRPLASAPHFTASSLLAAVARRG